MRIDDPNNDCTFEAVDVCVHSSNNVFSRRVGSMYFHAVPHRADAPRHSHIPARSCPDSLATARFGEKGEHAGGTASRARQAVSDNSRVIPAGHVRLERRGWGAFPQGFHEYSQLLPSIKRPPTALLGIGVSRHSIVPAI